MEERNTRFNSLSISTRATGGFTGAVERQATPSAIIRLLSYNGGAMASHASEIDYGGEVVGTTSFPGMGSGHFANQGWTKACYQKNITYFPTTGGQVNASLTPSQAWPSCYTSQVTLYASPWFESAFYGGPGRGKLLGTTLITG